MRVLGYSRYSGDFDGKKYEGYFVHCAKPLGKNVEGVGEQVERIKVKSSSEAYAGVPMLAPGDEILPLYDARGNCIEIRAI